MKRFRRQRFAGIVFLVLACALAVMAYVQLSRGLPYYAHLTGWVLFAVMVVLAVYNVRKKLPFLPLGKSEHWLQFHIYAGFLTVALFLIHVDFRVPTGWFEGTLAWLYVLVTGSGMVGLVLSRVLPRRLATRGGEVIYEKIPAQRHALRQAAEALAFGETTRSPAIAEFYGRKLAGFFAGSRNFWRHLLESRQPLNVVMVELEDLRRYLNDRERATLEKLAQLVRQKDGLDYHHAVQTTLRLWLFVHVPLTYGLMILSLLHMVLVFAFSGGTR